MTNEAAFDSIKIRYLLILMIAFFVVMLPFMYLSRGLIAGAEWDVIFGFLFYTVIAFWIVQNLEKAKIYLPKFIGSFPYSYNWLALFTIIFSVIILTLGLGELGRYIVSTMNPNVLNNIPSTSVFYTPQASPLAPFLNFMDFFIAVIIAPIVEEFLFRGVILHRFTVKWSLRTAVIASSIIFGLLHSDIIGAFIFALVMCILYIKTATLLVPILAHMTNNMLAYGTKIMSTFTPQYSGATATHDLGFAVLLILVSGMFILYFLYTNWPQKWWTPPYFQEEIDGIPENLYY